MGKGKRERRLQDLARRDAEYRRVLGVESSQALPARIGTQSSAGGGRSAGRGGKNGSPDRLTALDRSDKRPAAELKITAEQVRSVKCPRCLAAVGAPCRNGRGEAYSTGHADRRRLADRTLAKRRSSGRPGKKSGTRDRSEQELGSALSPEQIALLKDYRAEQQPQTRG